MIADWALARSVISEGKIIEDAGPAVDMATEGELGSIRREEADGAGCWLASSLLQHHLVSNFHLQQYTSRQIRQGTTLNYWKQKT